MADSPRFWNLIARRYARMPVQDEASYREKLRRTRTLLQPDWQVLEIGCGTGSTALEHAPHVAQIRAVDFSQKMIDICREKAAAAGIDTVSFERADIATLDLPPSHFDAVLGMSILHLLDDRDGMIARVFDTLKPGGVFISSTVCLGDRAPFLLRVVLPVGAAFGLLPKVRAFDVADLIAAHTAAGFEIEESWQPGENPSKALFLIARKPSA